MKKKKSEKLSKLSRKRDKREYVVIPGVSFSSVPVLTVTPSAKGWNFKKK